MLTLNDGRNELWQWDTGRTINVPADCSQVHFSNKVFGRSIDVDVVDGVASIPDILLQTDKELTAWAFVGTAENGYTKISKIFKVNKRNKPADYAFTPPEQTTLGEILERLEDIESAQDPDAIKNAVEDYLADNPIQFSETDPTVPSWAKQPQKPTYTAEEVGALPFDTPIPSPYTLPVATSETLGGVKPTAATDDMTQPVGVDAEGRLFTAPGASGGEKWELIAEGEVEEDVETITVTEDTEGKSINLKKVAVYAILYSSIASEGKNIRYVSGNLSADAGTAANVYEDKAAMLYGYAEVTTYGTLQAFVVPVSNAAFYSTTQLRAAATHYIPGFATNGAQGLNALLHRTTDTGITEIGMSKSIKTGSAFKIYGVRA